MTRTERRHLAAVVAAGVVARIAWAAYATRTPVGLHDPALYRFLASSLARGDGYAYPDGPTAYYPVGYPAVLGASVKLLGDGLRSVVALNLAAAAVAVAATYALARRTAGLSHRRSLAAAGVVALLPNLVFHGAVAMGETLFLALFVPALVLARTRPAVAGVLLGAAVLVRPVALPVVVVLALLDRDRAGLRRTALTAGVAVLVLVPWVVRNAVVMDTAALSTNTGDNLCMSRQPGATGGFLLSDFCHAVPPGLDRPASERARDDHGLDVAVKFVEDEPLRELSLWPRRLANAFRHDHDALDVAESHGEDPFIPAGWRRLLGTGASVAFAALLVAAAASVPAWRRRDPRSLLLLAGSFVAVVVVPVVVFFGDPRFHVPGVPLLAVLAAGGVSRGWGRWGPSGRSPTTPSP